MRRIFLKGLFLALTCLGFVNIQSVYACTRALWVNDKAIVVGRTMDWAGDIRSNLWVFPRGMNREGLAEENSMKWTSKYGSIVTTAYDALSTDGMNEKGLAAHIFWLQESNYGDRDSNIPGLSVLMWEQYFLDNFASVDEAVQFVESTPFQIEPFELDTPMALHLILEDSTGDSAIMEYLDGQVHIYHDRSYTVAANSPAYDKQLANLRLYKGFGGDKSLPGTTDSVDRFVRAAFYSSHLPQPESERDAITKILSVTNNTAMPYGTSSDERPEPSETIWHTALDLTHHVYYFVSTTNHNLIWAYLDKFNLNKGAPVLKLDIVQHPDLAGDVTKEFQSGMLIKNPKMIRVVR